MSSYPPPTIRGTIYNSDQYSTDNTSTITSTNTEIVGPLTAFGDVRTSDLTSIFQATFPYTVNDRLFNETVVGTGTSSISNSRLTVSTGTTTGSNILLQTIKHMKYRAGQGALNRFTSIFTSPVDNTSQIIGVIDSQDGYAFGYNGLTFGILHRNSSSGILVDTWIPQTAWNLDRADGTQILPVLNQTKGNIYQIEFQYLGFGSIIFSVEDPETGMFEKVHIIKYANTNTNTSLSNPSLPFSMYVDNDTTTSDIIINCGSCALFSEGTIHPTSPIDNAFEGNITASASETQFFSLRSKATYGAHSNHVECFLKFLTASMSSSGNRNVSIKILLNPTLTTPSWADVDTNSSCLEIDTAGTLTAGTGIHLFTLVIANNSNSQVDLSSLDLFFIAGDIITISAETSSGSGDSSVSLIVLEDQ